MGYKTKLVTRNDVDMKFVDTCNCGDFQLQAPTKDELVTQSWICNVSAAGAPFEVRGQFVGISNGWCERGDLNPHGFTRQILSLVRLPIPPLSHSVLLLVSSTLLAASTSRRPIGSSCCRTIRHALRSYTRPAARWRQGWVPVPRWAYTIVIWNCTVTQELRDSGKIDTVRDKSGSIGSSIRTEPEKYSFDHNSFWGVAGSTSVIGTRRVANRPEPEDEMDTPRRTG